MSKNFITIIIYELKCVWVHTAVCQATSAIRYSQGSASITDALSNIPISIYTWNFDSTPPSPAW